MPTIECPICNKDHEPHLNTREKTLNGTTFQETYYSCHGWDYYDQELLLQNSEALREARRAQAQKGEEVK